MLSVLLEAEPDGQGGLPGGGRLWIGSDKGLFRVDLIENNEGVEAAAYASLVEAPPDHVRFGISWILPYDDGILFSAGTVYRYGPAGFPGWYWISIVGVLLILLGGWLFPGRETHDSAQEASA